MLLEPLQASDNGGQKQYIAPLPRTCEACGTVVEAGHFAINGMISVGSPGHPALAPFQCPKKEHWACSIDCWEQVMHACVTEHGKELLKALHKELQRVVSFNQV
jgi:hypothetical protein